MGECPRCSLMGQWRDDASGLCASCFYPADAPPQETKMDLGPKPTATEPVPPNGTFGWAVMRMKEGHRAQREGWNKDHWVCFMPPTTIHADHVNTRTRKFLPEGPLLVQGYFVVFTKVPDGPNEVTDEGKWGRWQPGWLPSTEDTLATDYLVLDP